jgi:plastocyanin
VKKLLLVLLIALAAACGGDETVGEDLQTEGFEDTETTRLGEREETTTTLATVETTVAPTDTTPDTTAAPAGPQIALEVSIRADDAPSQFEPSVARIYAGTCVRFVNADTVVRSVIADDDSFSSGDIPPGASYDYCPSAPARVNYHDGTRPYAVGSVEVLAQ